MNEITTLKLKGIFFLILSAGCVCAYMFIPTALPTIFGSAAGFLIVGIYFMRKAKILARDLIWGALKDER